MTVYPNLNLLKNTRTTSATSTSSPWIPSSSEVTAEDYPSYIGTYTDKNSNEQSTDPEKYTWKKIEQGKGI